jgi:hypothetical protein
MHSTSNQHFSVCFGVFDLLVEFLLSRNRKGLRIVCIEFHDLIVKGKNLIWCTFEISS